MDLVEELAKAICRDMEGDDGFEFQWRRRDGVNGDIYRHAARAILSRLDQLGLHVVQFPHGEVHTGSCPTCGARTMIECAGVGEK